jgi:capsular polysaccharide biosynthesis protein
MEISLKDLFVLLKKNLVFLLCCSLAGCTLAFLFFRFMVKPTYISNVELYVYTKESSMPAENYNSLNDLNYAQKIVNTYIEMLRTNSFMKEVKENTDLNYSIDDLKKMIKFTVLNDTEVFQVSVSSHKPEDAKQIADTITGLAPQTISSIKESALLKVVDSATFPASPSSPDIPVCSVFGFLCGAAVSIVYLLLKEMLDVRIKQEEDLAAKYNIPFLGSIPAFETQGANALIFAEKEGAKQ